MLHKKRVELHKSAEIPASAQEVWELLTDWSGMLRWSKSARSGSPLAALIKCELIGEADAVPRTRRMMLDTGALTEEKLFYQNNETRRLYYSKSDGFGTSGYVACSYVDALDDLRSGLHILSWFDFEGDASAGAARYEAIYEGIFDGFKAYFTPMT